VENQQTNYILMTSMPIADVVILSVPLGFDTELLYPAFASHSPGSLCFNSRLVDPPKRGPTLVPQVLVSSHLAFGSSCDSVVGSIGH